MAQAKTDRTVTMAKVRDTKNTSRYEEESTDSAPDAIGVLYVKKPAVEALGNPEKIKVTVAAA